MAQQQAQLLLHMSSLESVNFGVHQNNTEAFAVVLCHLAELHAEQVRWSRDPPAPPPSTVADGLVLPFRVSTAPWQSCCST